MRAFIKKLIHIKKDQDGFSLIELIATIGISSIIIIGLVITIFQLFTGHARSSGEMNVVRQVQQAGYYISRDVQMASEVVPDYDPDTPEVVTLTWYWFPVDDYYDRENPADRDGDGLRVIYTLEGDRLYRNYEKFDENLGDPEDPDYGEVTFGVLPYEYKTFIAEYINTIEILPMGNGFYAMTVTASIDGIAGEQVETRTYEIKPRPNVF